MVMTMEWGQLEFNEESAEFEGPDTLVLRPGYFLAVTLGKLILHKFPFLHL